MELLRPGDPGFETARQPWNSAVPPGRHAGPGSGSPHGPLTEPYALHLLGAPAGPEIAAKQRGLADALPVSGRKPYTFLAPAESAADAFTPGVTARLRRLKQRYDPGNVFRANFPVGG
jgi:hypothetical protein